MNKESVRRFFTGLGIAKWERLSKDPYYSHEFDTTIHFPEKHIPIAI